MSSGAPTPPDPSAADAGATPRTHSAAAEVHPAPHAGFAKGAHLWLVRHAEVHGDWRGKAYGDLDVPLSEEGRRRSRELARDLASLPPTALLTSPLQRARHLAQGITAASGIEAQECSGLREIHRGSWQGQTVESLHTDVPEEVAAFYADPWGWRGHGGECDADVHARAWPPIEATLAQGSGCIVVTTHYNVLRVLVAAALHIAPCRSFSLRVDTGAGVLLVDAPGGWELVRSNAFHPAP